VGADLYVFAIYERREAEYHRLSGLENQYAGFQTQMVQLRTDINKVTARVDGRERQRQVFENTVINLENQNRDLQQGVVFGADGMTGVLKERCGIAGCPYRSVLHAVHYIKGK
jgi:hypothetical protein